MYEISVIVPIFNSENTIDRVVASFLNQQWDGDIQNDLELILVDDCSTDSTKEIIDRYAVQYSNIYSYTTDKNTGSPSTARNIGINKSDSKYLMFMDSDDEYCEDMCKTLYDTIVREDVEVVSCNYCNIFPSFSKKIFYYFDVPCSRTENEFIIFDSDNSILSKNIVVWNKIFDKSIISKYNISFPYKVSEDIFFCWEYFSHIDKMIFLKEYYGIKRHVYSDSYSYGPHCRVVLNTIKSARELEKKLSNEYIDFNKYPKFKFSFAISSIEFILMRISFLIDDKSRRTCLNELYEYEKEISFDNSLNSKLYKFINFFILKNHLSFVIFLFKMLNIVKYVWRFFKKYMKLD